MGWDLFVLKVPIFGKLIEKNIMARTTRTLGTLVASRRADSRSAQHHPRDGRQRHLRADVRQGHATRIREGEAIAKPMKEHSEPGFHPVAAFFWFCVHRRADRPA